MKYTLNYSVTAAILRISCKNEMSISKKQKSVWVEPQEKTAFALCSIIDKA